jgi:hypothetical protein
MLILMLNGAMFHTSEITIDPTSIHRNAVALVFKINNQECKVLVSDVAKITELD